jgi:sterol desaturase/sphingolipid hydroxylase (fatty acid hydroxylase superfamily)
MLRRVSGVSPHPPSPPALAAHPGAPPLTAIAPEAVLERPAPTIATDPAADSADLRHPRLARCLRLLGWPLLLGGCIGLLALGMAWGRGPLAFGIAYALLALALYRLERFIPHERAWLVDDGQLPADLAHTLVSKSLAYWLVVTGASLGLYSTAPAAETLWPEHWPLWLQVLLGLTVAEFGFYWAHRVSHEWRPLWRFHAVHHSVRRLWFANTGRFHLMDTFRSMTFGLPLLFLLQAPELIFTWVSAITAFVGLLTHCNVDFRTRALHRVLNTPALHRWHHAPNAIEGNTNYGENLTVWDSLFGTYLDPADRSPPRVIGIPEFMPRDYLGQVWMPFRWNAIQARWRAGLIDPRRAL